MSESVNFIQGRKEQYNPSEMQGGLFFSKDSKEILLNGESYGNATPADEEDITAEEGNLKLKDRVYDEASFSGKGYKILRKNIVEGKNILTQDMINEPNTIYEIRYDFDLNEATINIPEGCVLQYKGGSINNGFIQSNLLSDSPSGSAVIINGNWKYIDIDQYYTGDLATTIDKIQKIFINDNYLGTKDSWQPYFINLRDGGIYNLNSGGVQLNRRFSFGSMSGVARINVNVSYSTPTAIFNIVRGNEAAYKEESLIFCGMHFLIQDATNAILFDTGNIDDNELGITIPGATFDRIGTTQYQGNPFYRIFRSYGYNDNFKFSNIYIGHPDRYTYGDIPKQIDFQISGSGDSISVDHCGEATSFAFLGRNNVKVDNGLNVQLINIGGSLLCSNCYSEVGIIHNYRGNLTIINSIIQNEHLSRQSSVYLDYDPLLQESWIKEVIGEKSQQIPGSAWGDYSIVKIISSNIINQLFGYAPDPDIDYKTIVDFGQNAIIEWEDKIIPSINLRSAHAKAQLSFNKQYISNVGPRFSVTCTNEGWYNPRRVEEDYVEERGETTFDIYSYIDKDRNIGTHVNTSIVPENNKFITLAFNDSQKSLNGTRLEIYRQFDNVKDKFTGNVSAYNNATWWTMLSSKYYVDNHLDKEQFSNLPTEPQSVVQYKWINNNQNIEVVMDALPTSGTWKDGDVVKLSSYYNSQYALMYERINGQWIYRTFNTSTLSIKGSNRLFKILDCSDSYEENKQVSISIVGPYETEYSNSITHIFQGAVYSLSYGEVPNQVNFYKDSDGSIYLHCTATGQSILFSIDTTSSIQFIGNIDESSLSSQGYTKIQKKSYNKIFNSEDLSANRNNFPGRVVYCEQLDKLLYWNGTSWIDPTENISWATIE